MWSFNSEIDVKTTMKQHLWTVKPLLNIWNVRLETEQPGKEIMTTHENKPGKNCCFFKTTLWPKRRKICSFMFHFHKPTMVEFFLAIFWLQTCQTRPELGMAQIVCIYLKLDYSKIMVLVFTKLVSTLETPQFLREHSQMTSFLC